MRWPVCGSSPVVSVSTTISRMSPPPSHPSAAASRQGAARFGLAQDTEDLLQLAQRAGPAQPRQHDKIGAAPLLAVRGLGGEDSPKARIGHPGPASHPLPL